MRRSTWVMLSLCGGFSVLARVGYQQLRPHSETHSSHESCGVVLWRTSFEVSKSLLDPNPTLVKNDSVATINGGQMLDDVESMRCLTRRDQKVAVVVSREAGSFVVRVFDAGSGAVVDSFGVEGPVDVLRVAQDGEWIATATSEGAIHAYAIAGPRDALGRRALSTLGPHATPVVAGSLAWSKEAELCWIATAAPNGGPATAALWCAQAPDELAAPREVKRAGWRAGEGAVPWVGFFDKKPHLCGHSIVPSDPDCRGLEHPQ